MNIQLMDFYEAFKIHIFEKYWHEKCSLCKVK